MDYPEDFDTPAFPAGKRIAISRTLSVWVMVAFFFCIVLCVAIPWIQKGRTVNPYVIYVDGMRGRWEMVGQTKSQKIVPYYESVQRALVGIFTEKWLTISDNPDKNARNWMQCNRETDCVDRISNTFESSNGCDLYCMMGDGMYNRFAEKVLPLYKSYASIGQRWFVDENKIAIIPSGTISDDGGMWVTRARVRSNLNGDFNVVAYVKVARDTQERYPQTFGFYVTEFNAYREWQ